MTGTINIEKGTKPINITVGSNTINITSGTTVRTSGASFVEEDTLLTLDGETGDSGFKKNSSTGRVEVWVDGTKKMEF